MTRRLGGCFLLFTVATGSLLAGCDSAADAAPESAMTAQQIRATFHGIYANAGSYATDNGVAYDSPEALLAGARAQFAATYGADSDQYRTLNTSLTSAYNAAPASGHRGKTDDSELPAHLQFAKSHVDQAIDEATTLSDFSGRMNALTVQIDNSDWSAQEKMEANSYVVSLDETLNYLNDNGYFGGDGSESKLLPPFWRCAGGIFSEGLIYGGALAGVGSAVPGFGTTAGAIVGGVAGMIHGAVIYC